MNPDILASNAFFEKFDLHETIGTGAFSEVKIGIEKSTGAKYAIKIVDRSKCKGKEDMVETEVRILSMIKHENIVQLHEMYEFHGKIYLVMELVTGGELFDEIMGRGTFVEKDAAAIVQKILLAIQYLHRMGIVHRDLKPENLLLSDRTPHPEIKISDFGLSKIFKNAGAMKTACGTPGYVAPEVLKKRGYGPQVDLWSLGVITYILLSGYPPFFDSNNTELFKKIMAGRYQFDMPWWNNVSETAKDFIKKLLVVDPHVRYNATQALQHPFILENCFPAAQTAAAEVVIPILKPIAVRYPVAIKTTSDTATTNPVPPNAPKAQRYFFAKKQDTDMIHSKPQQLPPPLIGLGLYGGKKSQPQQQAQNNRPYYTLTREEVEYQHANKYSMYPPVSDIQNPIQPQSRNTESRNIKVQTNSMIVLEEETIIDFGSSFPAKGRKEGKGTRIPSWFNFFDPRS